MRANIGPTMTEIKVIFAIILHQTMKKRSITLVNDYIGYEKAWKHLYKKYPNS